MYIPSRCSTDVCMEVWVEGWEDRWMEVVVRGGEGTCVCTHDCAVFSRVYTEILGPATSTLDGRLNRKEEETHYQVARDQNQPPHTPMKFVCFFL